VPGDLLHLCLGSQSLVLIKSALAHRKVDFALEKESPAKHFLIRGAESRDDVAASTTATQRLAAFRSSSFYSYLNHGGLFSKKRVALRLQIGMVSTLRDVSIVMALILTMWLLLLANADEKGD
jgi:hypothetical protein